MLKESAKLILGLIIFLIAVAFVVTIYLPGRIDDVRVDTKQMVDAGIAKAMTVAAPVVSDRTPQLTELKETVRSLEREIVSFEAGLAERDRALADLRTRVAASEQQSANAVNTANSALTAARNAAAVPAPVPAPAAPAYVQQPAAVVPRPTAIPVGAIVETPAPSAVMATTVEHWRFEVKRVTVSDKMANVEITLTPLQEDTLIRIDDDTVAYDQAGREMILRAGTVGGRRQFTSNGGIDAVFIAGIPTEVVLAFEGPSSQISSVASMSIEFVVNNRTGYLAKFRNIPLAQ